MITPSNNFSVVSHRSLDLAPNVSEHLHSPCLTQIDNKNYLKVRKTHNTVSKSCYNTETHILTLIEKGKFTAQMFKSFYL